MLEERNQWVKPIMIRTNVTYFFIQFVISRSTSCRLSAAASPQVVDSFVCELETGGQFQAFELAKVLRVQKFGNVSTSVSTPAHRVFLRECTVDVTAISVYHRPLLGGRPGSTDLLDKIRRLYLNPNLILLNICSKRHRFRYWNCAARLVQSFCFVLNSWIVFTFDFVT